MGLNGRGLNYRGNKQQALPAFRIRRIHFSNYQAVDAILNNGFLYFGKKAPAPVN